ncbi:MAG: LysR family transcriptional regulator [Acidobacteriaceae bacterium]
MLEYFRLKVFRTVAEQSSFRKASEVLNITQPAVSQQVQALEEDLGMALFDRSGSRVSLTAAGTVLLKYAQRAAAVAAEAAAELAAMQGETAGELRIGSSTTVAQYILPQMLARFRKYHPKVTISVVSGNTEWTVEALLRGDISAGVIEGPASSAEIHKQKLLDDRMVLIVPGGHAWAKRENVELEKLPEIPLLMRERGSGSRRVVETALRKAGMRLGRLQIEMELDTTGAIIAGVEAGLGAGFVSLVAVDKEERMGGVKALPVKGLEIVRPITLIRRAGPQAEGPVKAFEEFATAEAKAAARKR